MGRIVGRDAELGSLRRFLDDASTGPAAFELAGDAGIGKSALWGAGVTIAHELGFRVLSCRPAEFEARLAYSAQSDLLADAFDEVAGELPEVQRRAIEIALLRTRPEGPLADRTVAAATLGVLCSLADHQPVLVAIDDVQWIDLDSAGVLAYCVRRLGREPVRILTASRVAEDPVDPLGLERALGRDRVQRVLVPPLDVDAVAWLLADRLAFRPVKGVLHRICESSRGNPLFALEIARVVQEAGGALGPGEVLPASQGIQQVLRGRLAALPTPVREALLVAAAASRPSVSLVAAASAGDRVVAAALDRAADAGVIELVGEEIRFVHPLYASAVYVNAGPSLQRDAHRLLADVVEDPEERARHLALSTLEPDAGVAAVLEKAAKLADERGAPSASAELCELAAGLTPVEAAGDRRRFQLSGADYRFRAGDLSGAVALLEPVLAASPPGPDRADVLVRLGRIHLEDDLAAATASLEEALAQDDTSAAVGEEAHADLAVVLMNQARLEEAERHAKVALALAEEVGDPHVISDAITLGVEPALYLGRGLDRVALDRAIAMAGSPDEWFPVYYHPSAVLGILLAVLDRHDEAHSVLSDLLVVADDRGDEPSSSFIHGWLARIDLLSGRWDAAVMHASSTWLPVAAGLVHVHRGEAVTIEPELLEMLSTAEHSGHVGDILTALEALGAAELLRGNPSSAHAYLDRAWEIIRGSGATEPNKALFLPDEIEALIQLGRFDEVEGLVSWLEDGGRRFERPRAIATSARCRALLSAARGDPKGALLALDRSLRAHERLADPFELGRTLLVLGGVRRRARQKRTARDALQQALSIFEQLGATPWSERARTELASIGGRPPPTGDLTPTERRVALMAAAGRTNREIADALFLSVRTVAGHLSHIYRKLGVRSRTELAAVLRPDDVHDRAPKGKVAHL
jgi:DNA-binding CsgD family transcriptional regulator